MVIFAGWSLLGFIQLKEVSRRWTLSALCPMVLAIGLPWALPQSLIDSAAGALHRGQSGRADEVGHPAGQRRRTGLLPRLGHPAQRDQPVRQQGEVHYGLGYPDAAGRYVARADFPAWLAQARKNGQVALLMKTDRDGNTGPVPPPTRPSSATG